MNTEINGKKELRLPTSDALPLWVQLEKIGCPLWEHASRLWLQEQRENKMKGGDSE